MLAHFRAGHAERYTLDRFFNMKENWIIPFKGRNPSGAYGLNLLWNAGSTYVMDNHRAALWCWLQHISKKHNYNYFHIDRHYDTLTSQIEEWDFHLPDLWSLKIDDYLTSEYKTCTGDSVPTIRWDNYLSIFLKRHKNLLKTAYFATHKDGDKPDLKDFVEVDVWELPREFAFWVSDHEGKWICNIDLDFFFFDQNSESTERMFTQSYCKKLFEEIGKKLADGSIEVLTIALSPEWCGSWQASEKLIKEITASLGVNFALPNCGV